MLIVGEQTLELLGLGPVESAAGFQPTVTDDCNMSMTLRFPYEGLQIQVLHLQAALKINVPKLRQSPTGPQPPDIARTDQ